MEIFVSREIDNILNCTCHGKSVFDCHCPLITTTVVCFTNTNPLLIHYQSQMLKDLTVHSEFSITSANAVIDTRVNIEHYAAKVVRKPSKQALTQPGTFNITFV